MRTTFYVYDVTETGKFIRRTKTTNYYAIQNIIAYAKLLNGRDETCRMAIVSYQDGKKLGEWRNYKA